MSTPYDDRADGELVESYMLGWGRMQQCHICRRTNLPVAYWVKIAPHGSANVCEDCGRPRWEMQELHRLVNG